jgi:Spy/CpxP family protein refolding chaperone
MKSGIRRNGVLAATAASALVIGLAFTGPAWAQGGHPHQPAPTRIQMEPGLDGVMMMTRVFHRLALTPQQQQQIKGILQTHEQELRSLGDQAFSARQSLHKAVVANNAAEIATANDKLSTAQLNMEKLHAAIRAQIFDKVLTAEQRTKANSMDAQFEQRMAARNERQQQRFSRWLAGGKSSHGSGN